MRWPSLPGVTPYVKLLGLLLGAASIPVAPALGQPVPGGEAMRLRPAAVAPRPQPRRVAAGGAMLLGGAAAATAATGPLPAAPAEAPPSPADLSATPRPAQPLPAAEALPPLALPTGMEALPQGGFRLRFAGAAESLPPAAAGTLAELGRRLAAGPEGRIVLSGQASGPAADVSVARRLSLARSLAVKQALVAGGLAPTRIDVRPLGRTADVADAVDVQPPEAQAAP